VDCLTGIDVSSNSTSLLDTSERENMLEFERTLKAGTLSGQDSGMLNRVVSHVNSRDQVTL
jgi:hypothetical protein